MHDVNLMATILDRIWTSSSNLQNCIKGSADTKWLAFKVCWQQQLLIFKEAQKAYQRDQCLSMCKPAKKTNNEYYGLESSQPNQQKQRALEQQVGVMSMNQDWQLVFLHGFPRLGYNYWLQCCKESHMASRHCEITLLIIILSMHAQMHRNIYLAITPHKGA